MLRHAHTQSIKYIMASCSIHTPEEQNRTKFSIEYSDQIILANRKKTTMSHIFPQIGRKITHCSSVEYFQHNGKKSHHYYLNYIAVSKMYNDKNIASWFLCERNVNWSCLINISNAVEHFSINGRIEKKNSSLVASINHLNRASIPKQKSIKLTKLVYYVIHRIFHLKDAQWTFRSKKSITFKKWNLHSLSFKVSTLNVF